MTNFENAVARVPFANNFGEVWTNASDIRLEDLPVDEIVNRFKQSGALLFRGFPVNIDIFKTFTDALCPAFMSYEGGASARKSVGGNETILTVTEPSMLHGIPLHGEMYYTRTRPKVLFFYCERPANQGGETTIADGFMLYDALSPGTRRYFEKHRIKYVCTYPDGRWQQLFQTESPQDVKAYCRENDLDFHLNDDKSIITEYLASAISKPLYSDNPSFINNIFTMVRWEQAGFGMRLVRDERGAPLKREIVEELQQIETELTLPVAWDKADILMVDNTRMLHGRRAFQDEKRSIYVRLGDELH